VPPAGRVDWPPIIKTYPLLGSALPATSGMPRPTWPSLTETGTPAPTCQGGNGKTSLIPPPVTPLSSGSYQVDWVNEDVVWLIVVPPQQVTNGVRGRIEHMRLLVADTAVRPGVA